MPAELELTIGELFPAEDVLAQWVYSVTCVAEDVHVVMDLLKGLPRDEHSLRPSMYVWAGLLMTRIHEARRVVWAVDMIQEVRELVGDRLGPRGGLNLCEVYAKRDGDRSLWRSCTATRGIGAFTTRGLEAPSSEACFVTIAAFRRGSSSEPTTTMARASSRSG